MSYFCGGIRCEAGEGALSAQDEIILMTLFPISIKFDGLLVKVKRCVVLFITLMMLSACFRVVRVKRYQSSGRFISICFKKLL